MITPIEKVSPDRLLEAQVVAGTVWGGPGRVRHSARTERFNCAMTYISSVVVEFVLSQNPESHGRNGIKGPSADALEFTSGPCVTVARDTARGCNILVFLMFFKTPAIKRSSFVVMML